METNNILDLKAIIIALREERGWTPAELAKRAGVTDAAISYIESGQKTPRFETMIKIACAFGMDLIELLSYQNNISDSESKNKSDEKSELIEWALRPENFPYLLFAKHIASEVPADQLKHLEVRKTLNINIELNGEKEEGK